MEAVGEAVEAIKELRDPKWILDRRNSGKLFWRRESAASDKRCVKFRCDVEVLEFLKSEAERQDWSEDEDEERRRTKQWDREIPPPSSFWGGVCALLIAAVLTYQWLAVWLRQRGPKPESGILNCVEAGEVLQKGAKKELTNYCPIVFVKIVLKVFIKT